jgi:multiple sugar transport system substrate-binding protein
MNDHIIYKVNNPQSPGRVFAASSHPKKARRFQLALLAAFSICLAGCPRAPTDSGQPVEKSPLSGVRLTLAVADDAELAAAITRLKGEWNAQTGAEVNVLQITEKDLAASAILPADAVVCDPRLIGPFAEKKMIAPVPATVQRTAQWADVFDLVRQQEVAWGGTTMAIPFGSPVFVVYCRADLLEKLSRKPPQTWAEYLELAGLLSSAGKSTADAPWFGTAEPLAPGWAGLVLLARAAPYAKHRDNYSALFNIKTLEPLVAGPPMVRALEELVAAAKLASPDALNSDPAAVRKAFWQGRCGMALTWPSAAERRPQGQPEGVAETQIPVTFSALPGSEKVFNINNQTWETRVEDENPRVPFLSLAGRAGMVSRASSHPQAAFELLIWLSNEQNSPQICPASPATTLFRHSQLRQPGLWVEKVVPPVAAAKYAELTAETLRAEQWLALRIPGRAKYLAALDEAVLAAVRGDLAPADALAEAAKTWQEITEELGLETQRTAYLHSLGLE